MVMYALLMFVGTNYGRLVCGYSAPDCALYHALQILFK